MQPGHGRDHPHHLGAHAVGRRRQVGPPAAADGERHPQHPVVGDLVLSFDALELPAERGQTLTAYTAEPNTLASEKLQLLASWAATEIQQTESRTADKTEA